MSKRYLREYAGKKDVITYSVYQDNNHVADFVGNKDAALSKAKSLSGNTKILKTRITQRLDKSEEI